MNGWSACQTQKGSLVVGKHITVPIFLKALQVIYCTNKNIFMHKQPPPPSTKKICNTDTIPRG
jgi:hypothetical protein